MSLVIVSAAKSKVLVDGNEVLGVQSIDFKVRRRQADIEAIGVAERIGIESGQVVVNGTLRVSSLNTALDTVLYAVDPPGFNMVLTLNVAEGTKVRQITFDECYLDDKTFEMTANGVGVTSYSFTSTRVREE
ncbi:MAG: hypothetical protein OEW93_09390 [Candidatus Bathyarchaeota archaeon]|nr:hypothetical protein [Candidatus Bathyarchaeota archaeon]MDH5791228.1 hypothetical protein [Candidatus Bathyarchaeota archaeon]